MANLFVDKRFSQSTPLDLSSMNQPAVRFTRRKCSLLFLLICLTSPLISGIPIAGIPVINPTQLSVSDDFAQNLKDSDPASEVTKNTEPNDSPLNIKNRNGDDTTGEKFEGINERNSNLNSPITGGNVGGTERNEETDGVENQIQRRHTLTFTLPTSQSIGYLPQNTVKADKQDGNTRQTILELDKTLSEFNGTPLPTSQSIGYLPQNTKAGKRKQTLAELDKTISELNELDEEEDERQRRKSPKLSKLVQQKQSLQNIDEKYQRLKEGDLPELNSELKLYNGQQKKETDEPGNNQTQANTGSKSPQEKILPGRTGALEETRKEIEGDNRMDQNLSRKEKRVKLQDALNKLKEAYDALKKPSQSDIYSPPGIAIDHDRQRQVQRKLRLLKSEKGAFELSVNHGFDVMPHRMNHVSRTAFRTVRHRDLMTATLARARARERRANLRRNPWLRMEVARLEIRPFTGIGHSESQNFFGPEPTYTWTLVPSHYTYLGLINTPEKFKTTEIDRRILSHYNMEVLGELQGDLYEGDLVREEEKEKEEEEETSGEEVYEADGQAMKRIGAEDFHANASSRRAFDELNLFSGAVVENG